MEANVLHLKITDENREWLRANSRETGMTQAKLVNILIDFARSSGMKIQPAELTVPS